MPPPTSRIGTTVAGRYRLEKLLGQGGMGEVYVAVQEPLGRRIALKLIRATLLEHGAASSRFEREAKSLAALAHPNIVTLFDFGRTDDGEMYMAMELLPGESLRRRLETVGRLPPRKALDLVKDVCRALEAAHRAGIVHRDLKPDNVMLADQSKGGGPKDVVKVLDFGIARLNDTDESNPHITQTGHIVGTPGYIAPEMFTEGVLDDPRSDLYAVGVLIWELLTNAALFTAPTPVMLLMKHAQAPPPTLLSTIKDGDAKPHPALEAFLATLLHKNRHQRFASAAAVVDAIDALPVEAFAPFGSDSRVRSLEHSNPGKMRSSLDPAAPTLAETGIDVDKAAGVDVAAPTMISQRRTPTPETGNTDVGAALIVPPPTPARSPLPLVAAVAAVVFVVVLALIVKARPPEELVPPPPPPPPVTVLPVPPPPPPTPTIAPPTVTTPPVETPPVETTPKTTKKPPKKKPPPTTTKPEPHVHVPDLN